MVKKCWEGSLINCLLILRLFFECLQLNLELLLGELVNHELFLFHLLHFLLKVVNVESNRRFRSSKHFFNLFRLFYFVFFPGRNELFAIVVFDF